MGRITDVNRVMEELQAAREHMNELGDPAHDIVINAMWHAWELLDELVPKRPILKDGQRRCPVCYGFLGENDRYCSYCGQAISLVIQETEVSTGADEGISGGAD